MNAPSNVLFNPPAMAVLREARQKLLNLGLHCAFEPIPLTPGNGLALALTVAPSAETLPVLDRLLAASPAPLP